MGFHTQARTAQLEGSLSQASSTLSHGALFSWKIMFAPLALKGLILLKQLVTSGSRAVETCLSEQRLASARNSTGLEGFCVGIWPRWAGGAFELTIHSVFWWKVVRWPWLWVFKERTLLDGHEYNYALHDIDLKTPPGKSKQLAGWGDGGGNRTRRLQEGNSAISYTLFCTCPP